ncbi:MAG: penicillin-binding protein [Vicinamibacterales bacterium]
MWKRLFTLEPDPAASRPDPAARAVQASLPLVSRAEASANPEPAVWRGLLRRRVLVVLACLGFWVAVIEARLVNLQVVQAADYRDQANRQQNAVFTTLGIRGDIVDRNGRQLAYSVEDRALNADPTLIEDVPATLTAICGVIQCDRKERETLKWRFEQKRQYASIRPARQLSPAEVDRVLALDLPGIYATPESVRYYPQTTLAAQLVGFVGQGDDATVTGRAGLESQFDDEIRGEDGRLVVLHDASQRRLKTLTVQAPTPGATVELTIDSQLQYIAERELERGVRENRAVAGTAIALDPMTGDILALANYPTFNPNAPDRVTSELWKNRAVQDIYEPGSTFKIVTAAAALEEGVLRPSDLIDVTGGLLRVPGRRRPIYDDHQYGVLTFEDVIVKSSNVGAAKAGLRIGAERFSRYVRRFGFGQQIMPHFPGESAGLVHTGADLTDVTLSSMAMGYEVGVTPIQMVSAAASIANGGTLMEPHLIKAFVRDGVREEVGPKAIRRTVTRETADTITAIMEEVVARGTATAAKMDRYRVAGKTGTAKKAIPGGYSETDRVASFVGFVPSRQPRFAILVVVDTPRAGTVYGGSVAAPVFKRIAEGALRYAGVAPTVNPEPPLLIRRAALATRPAGPAVVPTALQTIADGALPDVRGLAAREAMRVLAAAGVTVQPTGSGTVVDQSPAPGTPLADVRAVDLTLRRGTPPGSGGGR